MDGYPPILIKRKGALCPECSGACCKPLDTPDRTPDKARTSGAQTTEALSEVSRSLLQATGHPGQDPGQGPDVRGSDDREPCPKCPEACCKPLDTPDRTPDKARTSGAQTTEALSEVSRSLLQASGHPGQTPDKARTSGAQTSGALSEVSRSVLQASGHPGQGPDVRGPGCPAVPVVRGSISFSPTAGFRGGAIKGDLLHLQP